MANPEPRALNFSRGALVTLLLVLTGCAGYQIGNQSLYPGHIRTVYVPMFESGSFRRNLGERLTEAVQKQIEQKTPYKVTGRPDADSILTGRIVSETKRVVVGARSGDSREIQTNLMVEVSWIDNQGNVLRETAAVEFPEALATVGGKANVLPESGQSIATAHQQAIHRLAEQIVSLMERPW